MSNIEEDGAQTLVADEDLIRVSTPGETLSPFLVLFTYAQGAFALGRNHERTLWWSPEPRAVLFPAQVHISKSLRKVLRKNRFRVTADTAFQRVLHLCRTTRDATWINDETEEVFMALHRLGHAHSVETWLDGRLVGGLYGVAIGQLFCGCSMFHLEADASKVAFVRLAEKLSPFGFLVDCQMQTPHLKRMGSRLILRQQFRNLLVNLVRGRQMLGSWSELFSQKALPESTVYKQ